MKRVMSILIVCFLSVFLVSCATVNRGNNKEKARAEPRQEKELEYGRLIFMGNECVAWFSQDLNIIGPSDMKEYFQKNKLEPTESKVLQHFAALGWEVVEKSQTDKYTTEYRLKRGKAK